jgi:hypothetical protein
VGNLWITVDNCGKARVYLVIKYVPMWKNNPTTTLLPHNR